MNGEFKLENTKIVRSLKAQSALFSEIKELQISDDHLSSLMDKYWKGEQSKFKIRDDAVICYKSHVCVPNYLELKGKILGEANQVNTPSYLAIQRCIETYETLFSGMV